MKVHYDLLQLPIFNNAVITIGTFDGVHTGHRAIIKQLKDEAIKIHGETVIITFNPHPRTVIGDTSKPLHLLNTLSEKIELLSQQGIDHLVVVPFTQTFAQQTAEAYVHDFLMKNFHPHTIIIGYDHHFGQGRKGNYLLLEALKESLGFELKEIPAQLLEHSAISSTRIRDAIKNGDMLTANQSLGYDYFFEGEVVKGNQLGRTIGYPTANLQIQDAYKLLPGNGVYAVKCNLDGSWQMTDDSNQTKDDKRQATLIEIKENQENQNFANRHLPSTIRHLNGMMNIGFRPTIDGTKLTVEVNIFDFDEDIYGKMLRVYVKAHLRNERKFNGLDALKQQLAMDKTNAEKVLSEL